MEKQYFEIEQKNAARIAANPKACPFLANAPEMSLRLATIVAGGRNPSGPRVTLEDLNWGYDVASWSADAMIRWAVRL